MIIKNNLLGVFPVWRRKMPKSMEFEIAKRLTDMYMGLEESQMTDVEKDIREELKIKKYDPSTRDYARTDFFRKRIEKIEEEFRKETSDIKTDEETFAVPKPVFRICDYDIGDQVDFYKSYIENTYKIDSETRKTNRKANSKYNAKVDVDQDYGFIMQVLEGMDTGIDYPDLDIIEDSFETTLYSNCKKKIYDGAITFCKEYNKEDKVILQDAYIQEVWESHSPAKHLLYTLKLADMWIAFRKDFLADESMDCDMGMAQKKYYVRWDLWMYVVVQNFQYLFMRNSINKSDIFSIIDGINKMKEDVQHLEYPKESLGIADAYFDYNYLLRARTLPVDEILFGSLKKNGHIFLKNEDLFLGEEISVEKCKYSKRELLEKFNSGMNKDDICTMEAFRKRLEFCEKFIPGYNKSANRALDVNDNRILRATYRALFVNNYNYNYREKPYTMAKKLFSEDERDKEKILSRHCILGMSITRENHLEYQGGKEFLEMKMSFLKEFYILTLNIINRCLPSVAASPECLDDLVEDLDNRMIEVLKLLYERIEPLV